jgi:hypothetical protein
MSCSFVNTVGGLSSAGGTAIASGGQSAENMWGPITYVVRPDGSDTWGLFESEMRGSRNTTVGPALGA